jgi:hypothetical protein
MALHLWRRRRNRRLGTHSTKNSPFISLNILSLGLIARYSFDSSSSFGAEETSMAKDMAEVTILGQSFVDNLLVQSKTFRQ